MLSLLVQARHEDGRPMSDKELRDELITLLVAGHETTATSLSWAIERLVRHPEKWERLREEALSGGGHLRGRRGEGDAAPAPGAADRRETADPAGRDRGLAAAGRRAGHALHPPRAPARPTCTPSRTRSARSGSSTSPPGTYTWIPFGGGVRRCLGATFALFEMKTVLKAIAREAALRPARQESERVARRVITLIPGRGTEVVMAPRRSRAPSRRLHRRRRPPDAAAAGHARNSRRTRARA